MPKRSRSKYNWPMVKQVYIAGKLNPETGESEDYTYTEIAAMFNVKSISSVKKRADKAGWDEARNRQKKKDEEKLRKKLEEMKVAELPDIIEMRRRLLKGQLLVLSKGIQQLEAGETEVKPIDIHRASEFIIQEYHTLFGIPQVAPVPDHPDDEPAIQINIGTKNDLHSLANNLRNGS